MDNTEITRKEIRGLNAKQLIWFFCGVISILITVMTTYSNIMYSIKDGQKSIVVTEAKIEILEREIKNVEIDQQLMDIRITKVEDHINDAIINKK